MLKEPSANRTFLKSYVRSIFVFVSDTATINKLFLTWMSFLKVLYVETSIIKSIYIRNNYQYKLIIRNKIYIVI